MGSPPIQCPKDVQAILDTMSAAQQSFRERRIKILQSLTWVSRQFPLVVRRVSMSHLVRDTLDRYDDNDWFIVSGFICSAMIPPRCSKTLITDWYKSLSSVNEQIGEQILVLYFLNIMFIYTFICAFCVLHFYVSSDCMHIDSIKSKLMNSSVTETQGVVILLAFVLTQMNYFIVAYLCCVLPYQFCSLLHFPLRRRMW